MCAILPFEGESVSYVRLNFLNQIKPRALIDTGSCADALPESLFNALNLFYPNSLTLEKPFCTTVRMASGQIVRLIIQQKFHFRSDLSIFKIVFCFFFSFSDYE